MRRFVSIRTSITIFIMALAVTAAFSSFNCDSAEAVTPPRGPGDVPESDPSITPRTESRRLGIGILLYLVSLALIGLEIYTFFDPNEAYMLLRRGIQFRSDVELTEFYLAILKYSAVAVILSYGTLMVLAGWGKVLIAVIATLAIGFAVMK
ncbi:MAG: hypothetical protein R6U92_02860 [Bacillota bacterium]